MRLHIAVAGTACAALAIVSPACGPRTSIAPATQRLAATGRIISVSVHSPSLERNLLGDPADQRVDIYLPPSYEREPARRFAAIYLLHGILGTPDDFTRPTFQRMTVQGAMDTLISTGRAPEMIVVVPNGRNKYGGSYYTNSTVTGNWEDYLVRDVVGYVDRTYRTIAQRDSRGIAGHSMGGYAAIMAGMKHPDVFGAVYAMSPCCLGWAAEFDVTNPGIPGLANLQSVDQLYALLQRGNAMPLSIISVAAAFSPDPKRLPFLVDLPADRTNAAALRARWDEYLPVHLASKYASSLKTLRGLVFDVGSADEYAHIPPTTRALSDSLVAMGVPHVFETYEGDHRNRLGARMSTRILPFFAATLRTDAGRDATKR